MLCIGLTGNIASGKSTIAEIFKTLAIEVIDSDELAKKLTEPNSEAFTKIIKHFGNDILLQDCTLNRKLLRNIIFNDKKQKLWLENLLHPLIIQEIQKAILLVKSPYCIVDIPLLYKKEDFPFIDRVLLVITDFKQQLARMATRDQASHDETLSIMKHQPDNISRLSLADDIIFNNGTIKDLKLAVYKLHHFYLSSAFLMNR